MRRAMHNQIQELRGNVPARQAGARRAPPAPPFRGASGGDRRGPRRHLGDGRPATPSDHFRQGVRPRVGRAEVFEEVSQLVQSALDGYKVRLFSYGQTGSGKTHTMLGAGAGPEAGIIPRAVRKVLDQAAALRAKGYAYTMEASYVEIYNEQIRDLLKPGADHDEKLSIAVAPAGGCPTVTGVEREPVTSADAAADLVRAPPPRARWSPRR